MKNTALILAAALTCAGCLIEDIRYDLYLYPDGSVEWLTIQSNVRSDQTDPTQRQQEETEFLAAATGGTHEAALVLRALGGHDVRSRILREKVPYAVVTSASFHSVEDLFRTLLEETGVRHEITLAHGEMVEGAPCDRLIIRLILDQNLREGDSPTDRIVYYIEEMRINLTEGRFVAARGFDISSGGLQAAPSEDDDQLEPEDADGDGVETVTFWLAWTPEGPARRGLD